MSSSIPYSDPVRRLAKAGRPNGPLDYAGEFGIGAEHVAELIDLTLQWADEEREWTEEEGYAPIHAWRALAQIRAVAAVQPLLSMQNRLDELGDDWYLNEFPRVFGEIGPPAIPHLKKYLFDLGNSEFPRAIAADGLRWVAERYPETRSEVVQILTERLEQRDAGKHHVNAELICALLDLKATESAEAIERAFAADVVDEGHCGDWETACKELGVPGLGLPQPANPYNTVRPLHESLQRAVRRAHQHQRRKKRKQLAAKLKQHRKKRK